MTQPDPIRFLEQLAAPPDPRVRYRLADILASVQAGRRHAERRRRTKRSWR